MKILKITIFLLTLYPALYSQWFPQVSGTTNRLQSVSFININTGMVCGYNGTIIKTTNAGLNWFQLNSGTFLNLEQVLMLNPLTALVLYSNGNIARTTNGGTNWDISLASSIETFAFCNNTTGWAAGGSCLLYKTTNAGENWMLLCSGSTGEGSPSYNFGSRANDTLVIFAGARSNSHAGSSRSIFRVGINSWSYRILELGTLYTIDMGNTTNGYIAGNGYKGYTTNLGYSWFETSHGGTPSIVDFIDPVNAVGVSWFDIYTTTNVGANWTVNFTYSQYLYNLQMINQNTGVAVGDSGTVLRTENLITSVNIISGNIPERFKLEQNYPNPFNPETNIEFSVPVQSNVKILIYDLLGRESAQVVNEYLQPGTYNSKFNASAMPSGVYIYKMIASGFTESRKMILIK